MFDKRSIGSKVRRVIVGKQKNPLDATIFHKLSLIAFFAWIGLGVDGLSSSCYGPEETFLALGGHNYLSIFVGLMSVITIFVISGSYSQIIEKFPSGGGGYVVASKLLSPTIGMVSGCALLIDYILTITLSIASGADAIFSFLPAGLLHYKLAVALAGVGILTLLNLRGVKESILSLVPIFAVFIITHVFVIAYAFISHAGDFHIVAGKVRNDITGTVSQIGIWGALALLMRAYSLGAGTYTGIEAVSNGLPVLREPKVVTGKKTMMYMSCSLAVMVFGLMAAYLLYGVEPVSGKTLNAVLFDKMTMGWGKYGPVFLTTVLLSEALILFVAAQTGFVDGPRVLANMAVDRWFPTRFASLSDRLVTQNGILVMGIAAFITMYCAEGSVKFMVILYSINVFITFCLSQLGMVRHWWAKKEKKWISGIIINGVGFLLCFFILCSVVTLKFGEGGWITLVITGLLASVAVWIKKHYAQTLSQLGRLNALMDVTKGSFGGKLSQGTGHFDPGHKTAVIFVNGYNGLGLHALFNVIKLFGKEFENYVFVQIGILDAGNFKGAEEVEHLKKLIEKGVDQYVQFMRSQGKYADGMTFVGIDVLSEIEKLGPVVMAKYPNSVFFGGQLVFSRNTIVDKWLHNYTVFSMQQRFYEEGIPFIILPIRV